MPIYFNVRTDSFIVCVIFVMVTLTIYSIRALWSLIINRRIEQKWIVVVLLFGSIGFVLGSLGAAPALYWLFGLIKYLLGILKALIS